jgi:hypothetical protein
MALEGTFERSNPIEAPAPPGQPPSAAGTAPDCATPAPPCAPSDPDFHALAPPLPRTGEGPGVRAPGRGVRGSTPGSYDRSNTLCLEYRG